MDDIFDFVATVRVGGRAGFPIRLSKEQIDYLGEYDIQSTWPFHGSGGQTWGNVSELPCAALYVDHGGAGVVKTYLRPERRQIEYAIQGAVTNTAILFFFERNQPNTHLEFVEIVVFTDQVIEVEGIDIHYWRGVV